MTETQPTPPLPTAPTRRITDAAGLLAHVPTVLGFTPTHSLVLVTASTTGQPFQARIDLPGDPATATARTGYLADVAARHAADRVYALTYTEDRAGSAMVLAALSDALEARGLALTAAIRADGRRWWAHDDRGERGRGTRYDVSTHPTTAQAVLEGTVLHDSREDLAASLVGRDPEEIAAVGVEADGAIDRLLRGLDHPLGPTAGRGHEVTEGRWVRSRLRRFLADGQPLDRPDVARLAVLMTSSLEVRDVAWAELDHANAAQHVDLWLDVVRRVPTDLRAAPAALLGLAAWVSGNGALAWCAVDRAHDADPRNSLAGLVADVLERAVPPRAWSPVPPEELTLFHEPGGAP